MGNSKLGTLIFLVLLLGLFAALYFVIGGDLRFWQHWGGSSVGSPFDGIIHGLGSITDSLSHTFSGLLH